MLLRRICAPTASRSRCINALTAPCVPTGMNAGVSTSPCAVVRTPRRARPSVWVTRKSKRALLIGECGQFTIDRSGRMYTATRHRCIAMLVVLATGIGSSARSEAALTGAARLTAIYDQILGARFEQAHELVATACAPAPREACQALDVAAWWWQIVLDPDGRALDARFESAARDAIDAASAWTVREPRPRRSVVLSGRRLCATRAVAGPQSAIDWRPRATAIGSEARSNGRSRSIRRCTTRSSGSASTTTTPTSRRRREDPALAAAAARRQSRAGTARNARSSRPGRAAEGRSRLPAALALSLVRAAARPCAGAARSNWTVAIRPTRSSSSASPKCRTNIFTTIPPAPRRGRRCSIDRRRADRRPRASRK